MDTEKCGFLLYAEYEEYLNVLSDEECGRLFRGIFAYERTREEPDGLSPAASIMFMLIRRRLDANREKYRKICETRRESGKKGGRPKKENTEENQKKPNGLIGDLTKPDTDIHTPSGGPESVCAEDASALCREIVERLNEKSGKQFRYQIKATQDKIKERLAEGFTKEDFFTVIDRKCDEWQSRGDMVQYLRPATLFGTKFEGYLNAAKRHVSGGDYIEAVARGESGFDTGEALEAALGRTYGQFPENV